MTFPMSRIESAPVSEIAASMAARGVRHLFVYKPLPGAERRINAAVEAALDFAFEHQLNETPAGVDGRCHAGDDQCQRRLDLGIRVPGGLHRQR